MLNMVLHSLYRFLDEYQLHRLLVDSLVIVHQDRALKRTNGVHSLIEIHKVSCIVSLKADAASGVHGPPHSYDFH